MSTTATEADQRICHQCKVFVPTGQPFFREVLERDGAIATDWGLCGPCLEKFRASGAGRQIAAEDSPYFGVACFIGLLITIGIVCLCAALVIFADCGKIDLVVAAGGLLWLALAVGLHLLRRILIAIETSKKGAPGKR